MTVESESSPDCFSSGMVWPPGFRFHPTDEELVLYYLKRKMCRRKLKLDAIAETDVYKWDPEDLPGQSILKTRDRQWFFFSPRDRKYPNGARSNRATTHGYWKATGKDRNVTCNSRTVGVKKTLVFYKGRAPNGERTDWVMHEYTLDEEELKRCQRVQDYYALYKVYKKSGPGPKNGEQYGALFNEEEWADDDSGDNIKSANQEVPRQQPNEATSVDTASVTKQLEPLFDDEFDEILKRLVDDEPILNHQPVSGYPALTQAVSEEIQSTMVDEISGGVMFPESGKMFHAGSEQCVGQRSYDVAQSAHSHFHVSEAPEVTSAPNIQDDRLYLPEEDFLEMDDLLGPEPTLSSIQNPVENLQFEDGLSDFDLYHDAAMFIREIGQVDQETFKHPYMGTLDNNIANQGYELLPNPGDAIQTGGELWMDNQSILNPAEQTDGSFTLPASGVVCESANFTTEGNLNQNSTVGEFSSSRFSSALWAFVESIPTTPASASENALVNRALERVSSFSRVRMNIKQADAAAGNDNATMKRAGRKGVLFLFFPVLVALCAFLWVSLGTHRLLWRCNS